MEAAKLCKQLNTIKKELHPWMAEVSERCAKYAIKNLGTAFDRFFKGIAKYLGGLRLLTNNGLDL